MQAFAVATIARGDSETRKHVDEAGPLPVRSTLATSSQSATEAKTRLVLRLMVRFDG